MPGLGVFFFFFGIGTLLGLAYVFIRYGIPLLALLFVSIIDVLHAWGGALKESWNESRNHKGLQ